MKNKIKERIHVKITTEERPDGRAPLHIVTWRPRPGERKRFATTDLADAESEANRIEELMKDNLTAVATIPKNTLMLLNVALEQLGGNPGTTLLNLLRGGAKETETSSVTVAEVVTMYQQRPGDFSSEHVRTVRKHLARFAKHYGHKAIVEVTHMEIHDYLKKEIGGAPKTQLQNLITLGAMFRWARDVGDGTNRFLPYGRPVASELVPRPNVVAKEHEIYTPEEFIKILVASPAELVLFFILGQLAGVRAFERCRMKWQHWRRQGEENVLVLTSDLTKTKRRRSIDVTPAVNEWLEQFKGAPDENIVRFYHPHKFTAGILETAGVPSKYNALRAGFASYHYVLHKNPALTSAITGHSIDELETTYKSITGVTKAKAEEMFSITPEKVLAYAKAKNLPEPSWSSLIK
jgi:integrase